MKPNLILQTDSYKLTHWSMYPSGTTTVYSYLEARRGSRYETTLWFGLQYILDEYLDGIRVTRADIDEAENVARHHFAGALFNRAGWERIVTRHGGRLPIRIRAAREGLAIPVGNVLMTVENTDPDVPWLTNAVESLLSKVWYPTTVATVSHHLRIVLHEAVIRTGGTPDDAKYLLHDFGYRGASSEESAAIGGAAHLLNFFGTDTLQGMELARRYYGASLDGLAHSVAASEHSIMTAAGRIGETQLARQIIATHQNQIVSIVADSYDYYDFVQAMVQAKDIVDRYKVRLVIRPDSITDQHRTPEEVVVWTLKTIDAALGSTPTRTGHKMIPYGILWGDGLTPEAILRVVRAVEAEGFAVQNLVFGMGGGLLQRVDRDTCRFAFKCSAQERDGVWHDVRKVPLDASKASKGGRLALVLDAVTGRYQTASPGSAWPHPGDLLEPVFEDGVVTRRQTFADIRASVAAAIGALPRVPVDSLAETC